MRSALGSDTRDGAALFPRLIRYRTRMSTHGTLLAIGAKLDAADTRKFTIHMQRAPCIWQQCQTIVINQFHIDDNCNYFDILFNSQFEFILSGVLWRLA